MNRSALYVCLAIAVPIAFLFGPALFSDTSFAVRDAGHFYHPLFAWCCRQWSAGQIPLWNPHENCGVPVLADATSSVFYPGKLLFLLPLDFATRYKLYITVHIVLAAAGSYWLARCWRSSPAAAALAAIAYAYGGGVAFQYSNVVFLVGAAWLPLAALAADRMLKSRSWSAAVGLGAILALMILGGDPQAAYHVLLITGLYVLVLVWSKDEPAAEEPVRPPRVWFLMLFSRLLLVGMAAVVGFLLAAVQVLPSAEATKYSERAAFNRPRNIYEAVTVALSPVEQKQPQGETRGQSIMRGWFANPEEGSHHDLVYDFSVGPWRLAEYVWPNVGGRMFPTNRRWFSLLPAEGRTWTPTLYLGLVPFVLAMGAFGLRRTTPRQRWLALLILLFTLASFGYYGIGWGVKEIYGTVLRQDASKLDLAPPVGGLYWLFVTLLPTYVYFRFPAKLLPLVSLGVTQLAAIGFDRAFAERRPRLERALSWLGGFSGGVALVIWFIGDGLFAKLGKGDSSLGPFDSAAAYRDTLMAFVQTMCVALAFRWLLQKSGSDTARSLRWQWTAVALTALELALANSWFVITAPADIWRGESPIASTIRSLGTAADDASREEPRVFRGNLSSWRPSSFRQSASLSRPAEMARWEHATLFPKHELTSGVSLVESYGSIKLMDYESLLFVAKQHGPQQPDKSYLPQPTALRLLGTKFLVLPDRLQPNFAERIADGRRSPPAVDSVDSARQNNWPEDAALWRMQRTLPRTWIVHRVEVLRPLTRPLRIEAVDQRTTEVLFPHNKARDFLQMAVVETSRPLPEWSVPTSERSAEAKPDIENCRITHYNSQRVVLEATLAAPGLVVLSDAWFPGWQATVTTNQSSTKVPIYRTNRVLRGVWLNAGQHTIEYRFEPASFVRGATVSALSWLMLAAWAITAWWMPRQRPA